jgi:hypothetical protein
MMGIFSRISKLLNPSTLDRNYWFFVRCQHCGEVLKGRVDLHNHLSIQYHGSAGPNTYYCRKVMIGSNRCFQPIEVELHFDKDRKLIDQSVKGGEFVTEKSYQESTENA